MAASRPRTAVERRALDAYVKLQRAAETALARTTGHLGRYDLTVSQFGALEALYHLGPLHQRDLARKLLRSAGNISIVLGNLEARGLISRRRDADDNRRVTVRITESGRRLIGSFFPAHVRGIVEEMSALGAAEQEELARLCRKLGLRRP